MVARRVDAGDNSKKPRRPPAMTPEAREQQLIADAYALAEKQIQEGTVSSPVLTHFLKLGTVRARVELARLEKENLLTDAKIRSADSGNNMEKLLGDAMRAFTEYKGGEVEDGDYN